MSQNERLARTAVYCESILKAAYSLGVRPRALRYTDWLEARPRGFANKKAIPSTAKTFAELRALADLCLPFAEVADTKWHSSTTLPEALKGVAKVVYGRSKATSKPAGEEDLVKTFGKDQAISALKAEKRTLLNKIQELRQREELLLDLQSQSKGIPVLQERDRTLVGLRQGIAKCFLSDVHFEEVIDETQVLWSNEYNPNIARRRLDNLVDGVAWKINCHRTGYNINQLIQTFGGDMITGYLHLDNKTSNAMPPLEAVLECKDALIKYLLDVLETAKLDKITVCCVCGNHGRNTEKIVHKNFVKNNYEWLMYHVMKDQLVNEERIEFLISTGGHLYSRAFDFVQRDLHGTEIGYQGGVGGVTIPLNKAIASWDRSIKADATWYGHYHSYLPHPHAIGNGSLCGFNEYAQNKKFPYEPPQQAFGIIDSTRGLRDVVALWVDSQWDHKIM